MILLLKKPGNTKAFSPLWSPLRQQNGNIIWIIAITKALSDLKPSQIALFFCCFLISLQPLLERFRHCIAELLGRDLHIAYRWKAYRRNLKSCSENPVHTAWLLFAVENLSSFSAFWRLLNLCKQIYSVVLLAVSQNRRYQKRCKGAVEKTEILWYTLYWVSISNCR